MMLHAQKTRQAKSVQKTTISVQEVQSESSSDSGVGGNGAGVGAGDGGQVPRMTPHDVDSHRVSSNASGPRCRPRTSGVERQASSVLYML